MGCHHITDRGKYYSAGNPNGDNRNAINVFKENLFSVNYTRDMSAVSKWTDIFTLVQYINKQNFFEAMQWVCNEIGVTLYDDLDEQLPSSISLTKMIVGMMSEVGDADDMSALSPIPESVLSYYSQCVNDMFLMDNISYSVQREFELGYDIRTNRITIPIRNFDGKLVGVKGRLFANRVGDRENKYIYLEPCAKGKVLFGLDKSMPYIGSRKVCYVGESEKFVMQLFSYGDCNCVSTGGKTVSRHQLQMLSHMGADIVLCLDQDVPLDEIKRISENIQDGVGVYAMLDTDNVLDQHESPSDNPNKWELLKANSIIKVK